MNPAAQTANSPSGSWLFWALGFVGGYGDAAGFVLARAFTGHATGNLVLGAIATAAGDFRSGLSHFSAVVAFLIGVFLGAWAMRPLKPSRLSTVMTVELILILVSPLLLSEHLTGTQLFVLCVSLALGLQNGAFRRAGGLSVHTTYLTGMITSLISSEAESCFDRADLDSIRPRRHNRSRCYIPLQTMGHVRNRLDSSRGDR